jgi:hypothetical protein
MFVKLREVTVKRPIHSQIKLSDFTVWRHTWRKNLVNCAVLTGNSAGLRTVLSVRLSHRKLRSSLKESHSFLNLPADTTMASSQGTSMSSNSFSRWASHDIFLFKYHFLLQILHFLFFFSDNIMADVASKQQTTALFLSTIVIRTLRHTELTKKLTNLMGNLCCARGHSVVFSAVFLHSWTAQFNRVYGNPLASTSICPRGTTRLPLDGFSWSLMLWAFLENLLRKLDVY